MGSREGRGPSGENPWNFYIKMKQWIILSPRNSSANLPLCSICLHLIEKAQSDEDQVECNKVSGENHFFTSSFFSPSSALRQSNTDTATAGAPRTHLLRRVSYATQLCASLHPLIFSQTDLTDSTSSFSLIHNIAVYEYIYHSRNGVIYTPWPWPHFASTVSILGHTL